MVRGAMEKHLGVVLSALLAVSLISLTSCAPPRTAAATQTTPAAFDAAQSDPKALAEVDAMMTALGGAQWASVKQLRWDLKYYQEDKMVNWMRHSWDIWNGRHRFEFVDGPGLEAYIAGTKKDPPVTDPPVFTLAMYDLFDHDGKGFVTNTEREGKPGDAGAMAADRDRIVEQAYEAWKRDSYQIAMFFKLKDPGVKLKYVGERQKVGDVCVTACLDIEVTFIQPGTDTYHVYLNKDTRIPEAVEQVLADGRSLTMAITSWTDMNGMKFPEKFKNIGPSEETRIENIQVGEPASALYVPRIHD